jgi:hypothetical protein
MYAPSFPSDIAPWPKVFDVRRDASRKPVFSRNFTRSIAQLFGGGVASIYRLAHQRLLLHCTPRCSGIFGCAETGFPRTSMVSHVHPRATAHFGAAGVCSRPHGRGSLAFPSIREGICSDSGGQTCISSGVQVASRRCAASPPPVFFFVWRACIGRGKVQALCRCMK